MNEARRKAWETRRKKYGARGHGSSYARQCAHCRRMAGVIVKLHADGVLSEGQAVAATGLDRVSVRQLADEFLEFRPTTPESGERQ